MGAKGLQGHYTDDGKQLALSLRRGIFLDPLQPVSSCQTSVSIHCILYLSLPKENKKWFDFPGTDLHLHFREFIRR